MSDVAFITESDLEGLEKLLSDCEALKERLYH